MARTQIDASLVPTAQKLAQYKRPQLGFGGVTAVGIDNYRTDGVNNYSQIIFPDGQWREEGNTTRRTFVITRNAILTAASAQSGLRNGLSEANNTWYAIYAVKISDSTSGFVVVGDTTLPTIGNATTLNSAYGTNSWVYLGMIRNGDNSGAPADILNFAMSGNTTRFRNTATGNDSAHGIRLANNASATSLTYNFSGGTGATNIPDHLSNVYWFGENGGSASGNAQISDASSNLMMIAPNTGKVGCTVLSPASAGLIVASSNAVFKEIFLTGFVDSVLGIGSNPII